jgi:Fe-S-cluster containining protein
METNHKEHFCTGDEMVNPCMSCGACCVAYRASFYWAEGDDTMEGGVPVHLTVNVNAFRRAMRRTNSQDQHCIALHGILGQRVQCTIYECRPSVCRNFEHSSKAGIRNPRCNEARVIVGLEPLCQNSQRLLGILP